MWTEKRCRHFRSATLRLSGMLSIKLTTSNFVLAQLLPGSTGLLLPHITSSGQVSEPRLQKGNKQRKERKEFSKEPTTMDTEHDQRIDHSVYPRPYVPGPRSRAGVTVDRDWPLVRFA
jgi:hypothetical protein